MKRNLEKNQKSIRNENDELEFKRYPKESINPVMEKPKNKTKKPNPIVFAVNKGIESNFIKFIIVPIVNLLFTNNDTK